MKLNEALTISQPLNEWTLPQFTRNIKRDIDSFTPKELANKIKALIGQSTLDPAVLDKADEQSIKDFESLMGDSKIQQVLKGFPDIKEAIDKIRKAANTGGEAIAQQPEQQPAPVQSNIDPKVKQQMLQIKKEVEAAKIKPKGTIDRLIDSYMKNPAKKRAYQLALKQGLVTT